MVFINVRVVMTVAMVKGLWTLLDNIYDYVFTTLDFRVILDGQFTNITIMNQPLP
jgi:hypothetical protein